jgi:tetratricopeptide (TPR) repeat protein
VNKARIQRDLCRYTDAIDTLSKAIEVVADKRDALAGIGYIYTEFLFKHDKALTYYELSLQRDPTDVTIRAAIAECLIKMGRYKEGRIKAEQLVGQLGNPDLESSVSLVILASYALEGDIPSRARQFDAFLDLFRNQSPRKVGPKGESAWVFSGLLEVIRSSNIGSESKFLVSTAIDVQQRKIARSKLSFFTSTRSQTGETSPDQQPATTDAGAS